MKTLRSSLVLITALAAIAESAYGQQPPDVVNSDAQANTATGTGALVNLQLSSDGSFGGNTASGYDALQMNTTGVQNTAIGANALWLNTTGHGNTAVAYYALGENTTGVGNSAFGLGALGNNSSGQINTAVGIAAIEQNRTGYSNTAVGGYALVSNTSGSHNTAVGVNAMQGCCYDPLTPQAYSSGNTALGADTLMLVTTGNYNTASGMNALFDNTTGNNNIAEGYQAGYNLTTGSNNIDIGNVGAAGESNTIRIGTKGTQKATVIAGIYGTPVNGAAVVVSSTGRLGVTVSSERYKTAISPMGLNTANLEQLRPVTFHLKTDPKGALQYGLVAEEVARVYPELVIRNESGRIDGVRYDELAPMLLNEVQRQAVEIRELKAQMTELKDLKQELHAALNRLQSKSELVAQR